MRIVVLGQAAFGEAVFAALRQRGDQIVGVCAPASPAGGRPDPLRAAAEAAGVPVLPTRRLRRDAATLQQFHDWRPELNVMAFVSDLLPLAVLQAPSKGTIQYHPSLLPRHRGASAINWAIMQGEARTGLSIFWPDEGVDTGPLLLQRDVAIGPDDTVASLYFNQLFPLGVEAMLAAVQMVEDGDAPRLEQEHSQATYEPVIADEHVRIRWNEEPDAVYNLIRGANPQPGAYATLDGEKLRIYDCERRPAQSGAPGTILAVAPDGVTVALRAGALLLKRVQLAGGAKVAAATFAEQRGLAVGQRLDDGAVG